MNATSRTLLLLSCTLLVGLSLGVGGAYLLNPVAAPPDLAVSFVPLSSEAVPDAPTVSPQALPPRRGQVGVVPGADTVRALEGVRQANFVSSAKVAETVWTTPIDQALTGRATVIDGDTLEILGKRIRLHGVDAPEAGQKCTDASHRTYICGKTAALALQNFLAESRPTRCVPKNLDRYGRIVATCYRSAGEDVAAFMVQSGNALDWPVFSNGYYLKQQQAAQKAHSGMWQGNFANPWDVRKASRH